MNKTIRFSGGHILDIDPSEIGEQFLTIAHNVNTRKGFPSRINGSRNIYSDYTGTDDPWHLLNINLNTINWWLVFGAQYIKAVSDAVIADVTAAGSIAVDQPHRWNTTLLNTIPVANNGSSAPISWSGFASDLFVPIPGWPVDTVCKFIVAFRYHLFAINIDKPSGIFENLIMHSDAAAPGELPSTWTAAAGNEAGDLVLSDTPGRCVMGVTQGQQLFIYKPTSAYAIEYIGQQPDKIFGQRPVSRCFGVYGPRSCVDLGGKHLLVGAGDVVVNDGMNFYSVADNRVKRALVNSIDETYAQNMFIVRDTEHRETWVCIPEAGNRFCTLAHVWDESRDMWTQRSLIKARHGTCGYVSDVAAKAIWDLDTDVWDSDNTPWNSGSIASIPRVVMAEPNTLTVADEETSASIDSIIQKLDMYFDDDTQQKIVTRVWIYGTGTGFSTLEFRLAARNQTSDPNTWTVFMPIQELGTPVEIRGIYISIQIRNLGLNPFTVNRVVMKWRYTGAY